MLKAFSAFHFRRRVYELTTVLYIISSIETLIGKPLLQNELWFGYSKASLAILLTFIAVDRYVSSFLPDVIKKEREQLNKLIGSN